MTLRPYGDPALVLQYMSNVKLRDPTGTVTKLMDRVANDVEGAFKLPEGEEFPTDFPRLLSIKNLVELGSACQGHLMYGDRQDAKLYCERYDKKLESLLVEDVLIEDEDTIGTMEHVEPETYPSNLAGTHLLGRRTGQFNNNGVPTP